MSQRGLAKILAGDDATHDSVERCRRQVTRWSGLGDGQGMSRKNAEKVGAVLGTDPVRYLSRQYDAIETAKRRAERARGDARQAAEEVARLRRQRRTGGDA